MKTHQNKKLHNTYGLLYGDTKKKQILFFTGPTYQYAIVIERGFLYKSVDMAVEWSSHLNLRNSLGFLGLSPPSHKINEHPIWYLKFLLILKWCDIKKIF